MAGRGASDMVVVVLGDDLKTGVIIRPGDLIMGISSDKRMPS